MGILPVWGLCTLSRRDSRKTFFSGARRSVAYLTLCPPVPWGPSASSCRGWWRDTGLDPLGSHGRMGSEGSDGPASLECSCGAQQAPAALGNGDQGLGCGRAGEGEQASARAAGTGALAPEQRGAAPRIPRIPARPRFRRHVVVLRAALTVRLGEGAHSRLRSACRPPRMRTRTRGPARFLTHPLPRYT